MSDSISFPLLLKPKTLVYGTIFFEFLSHSSTMIGDCSFTEENYGAIHRTPERDYQVQYAEIDFDRKL